MKFIIQQSMKFSPFKNVKIYFYAEYNRKPYTQFLFD